MESAASEKTEMGFKWCVYAWNTVRDFEDPTSIVLSADSEAVTESV